MDDMTAADRQVKGTAVHGAKLTPETAREIYKATGTNREVGQRFGIGHATIQLETPEGAGLCGLRPDHVV